MHTVTTTATARDTDTATARDTDRGLTFCQLTNCLAAAHPFVILPSLIYGVHTTHF